jgi:signal transduction histidine kinase
VKLHTKIIAAFIFLSLLSVIGYQIYWIKSFYKEQLAKIETDVAIAMRDADYKEISLRIDLVPNFSTYSNFLQIELIRKGIALESFVEKINLEENTIVESTQSNISQRNRFDFRQYVFPFDSEGIYAYRLNLKQPELFVLKQMSGILTGSVLMIVLIIFSYFYLYRIILRQKSLDEIKSDFINNMTHELKTPISVAYAATDALLNYGMMEDPTKRNQYLQISKEQLSRLSSLVEQILTMSVEERKNLKLVPETINLSELFLHLKNQYLLNVDKKIIINIDVEPENIIIEADKIHFPNMIGNLIENAVKYSGESVEINLSAKENNGKITISVKDNGIGIPPASLPKIFDRFYRVSTGNIHNVKGYGLGLHYVKTIVEKHGGKIFVKSKEGVGSEFVIEIKP